jgi:Predicted nucleotide-binding protein containing TIR-like domain
MIQQVDLFIQINNAILELQDAGLHTFERPLKTIARLLRHPELEPFNKELTRNIDFAAFMIASKETGRGMVGAHQLQWPDDQRDRLGLTLLLIEKFASEPQKFTGLCDLFFHTGSNKIIAGIHELNRQLIIPFIRDYKAYVLTNGSTEAKLIMPKSRKVFVVHGRDDATKNEVALFLRDIGLEPIILHMRPNGGRHILTKFREESEGAGFAVILMTPDDEGGLVREEPLWWVNRHQTCGKGPAKTWFLNLDFSSECWAPLT